MQPTSCYRAMRPSAPRWDRTSANSNWSKPTQRDSFSCTARPASVSRCRLPRPLRIETVHRNRKRVPTLSSALFSMPPLNRLPRSLLRTPPESAAKSAARARSCTRPARWLTALALLLALAACSTTTINESQTLWSEGHFEEAVTLLQGAVKKYPEDRNL